MVPPFVKMSLSNQHTHHVEDVGKILLQVQKDLAGLRQQIKAQPGGAQTPQQASDALERVIARAESDLRMKAEVVLNSMLQTTALTLPAIGTGAVMSTGPLTGQGGAELYGRQPSREAA